MKKLIRLVVGAGALLGLSVWAVPIAAGATGLQGGQGQSDRDGVVFVQTDNLGGNQVVAYDRSADGRLSLSSTYDTGGLGGALNGSVVDHLASQGSLTYDWYRGLLFAVNAGSNTVSVFSVRGDQLSLRQVVSSGGTFPVSVAVHGDLVYVLNAKGGGSVTGYRVHGDKLHFLAGSRRSLGLTIPSDDTQFTHTPGQVAFSPDGTRLLVTTKANGNDIVVFGVAPNGRLSHSRVVNPESDTTPFAMVFDGAGHLVVAEAGTNALATFSLHRDGTLTLIDAVGTGQAATCWVVPVRGFLYASNAGGSSESGYRDAFNGRLTLLGATPTDPGAVDASGSIDGQFLYVDTGGQGSVDEFHVNAGGTLTEVGSVTVPGDAGGQGIVAF
jgi:6-phosphogluconolactonase (cycloisomerase 2 family)